MQAYQETMDEVGQTWSVFQNRAAENVKMIASSGTMPEGLASIFALKAVDAEGKTADYGTGESQYNGLVMAQKAAVDGQRNVQQIETELFHKKEEYNAAISGTAPASTSAPAALPAKETSKK